MGTGFLKVQVKTAENTLPIPNAYVSLKNSEGLTLYETQTDINGSTGVIHPLPTPDKHYSTNPETSLEKNHMPCSFYNISVKAQGYVGKTIEGVCVFDEVVTTLPVNLVPLIKGEQPNTEEKYTLPLPALLSGIEHEHSNIPPTINPNENRSPSSFYAESYTIPSNFYHGRELFIPNKITVHLGIPSNSSVPDVHVDFVDYIKNVASNEIYPTWNRNALIANVHVITSFTLNRVYTEWYRSRNYNFDITNAIAFDQSFNPNSPIFDTISVIVDEYFNSYVRRIGMQNPLSTSYCAGTAGNVNAGCSGLSQWGSQTLALRGYDPLMILRHYYGDTIEIASSDNIADIVNSFPGYDLRLGSEGTPVLRNQNFLNRIRANYPGIPLISNPNGIFTESTQNAVRVFQTSQNMTTTGVIDRTTWNRIAMIHVGVTKLAELTGEGDRVTIGATPPTTSISEGSRGANVLELQFILNTLAAYYDTITPVVQDGIFGASLKISVIEFQRSFGLTADGIVGVGTWSKLYDVYKGIRDNVSVPPVQKPPAEDRPIFPGTILQVGSRGPDVRLMQTYLNNISIVYPNIPRLEVDSSFGSATQRAVIAFQQTFLLSPDGKIGPITWNKIVEIYLMVTGNASLSLEYPGTPLKLGSRGMPVQIMQSYLEEIKRPYPSIPSVTVDGIFGPNTQNAVIQFQRLFGLTPDGIIGPVTWYAIIKQRNAALGFNENA